MIHIVDLEPMKERYTLWWKEYVPNQIRKEGKPCRVISGEILTNKVENGTVLDAAGTNYYKSSQLKTISEMFYNKEIKPYDVFLIMDIWFPGIEMLRYMSQLYKIPIKIYGVWHAGSPTINDFAQPMHYWSRHFEVGFLNLCNGIFVGSEYSKESIITRLLYLCDGEESESISDRIYAYGMPLDFDYLQKFSREKKEKFIVFPHRPDPEKNPNMFFDMILALSTHWDDFNEYQFICCTSKQEYKSSEYWINALMGYVQKNISNFLIMKDLSKEDYYTLIGKSSLMISTTSEENFGYCAVEALALGCQILVPNNFSHPEIVEENEKLMYNDYSDLLIKIPNILTQKVPSCDLVAYVEPYKNTIYKWLETMGK